MLCYKSVLKPIYSDPISYFAIYPLKVFIIRHDGTIIYIPENWELLSVTNVQEACLTLVGREVLIGQDCVPLHARTCARKGPQKNRVRGQATARNQLLQVLAVPTVYLTFHFRLSRYHGRTTLTQP